MDVAVKEILDKCYQSAVEVIRENRADMDKVVAYLLEKETLPARRWWLLLKGAIPSW